MVETVDEDEEPDYAERLAADADVLKSAFEATLEDMEAMAQAREEEGWETVVIMAGDTGPEGREVGENDRFGLTFVVPGNKVEAFEEAFSRGSFPAYEVFRKEVNNRVFLVVEYRDPEIETSIFVAGAYELRHAANMVAAAEETGEMYTHFRTLDRTYLGSFRHDGHEKFVPHADRIEDWTMDAAADVGPSSHVDVEPGSGDDEAGN